jgi:hypothetical protein
MTSIIPTNTYGFTKYVVSSNIGQGNFTSIQAAINAASSGNTVFIADGSYSENVTLKAGVNITSLSPSGYSQNVILSGNYVFSGGGDVTISNVTFNSSSIYNISFNGSSAGSLSLIYCGFIQGANNCVNYSNSNSSSTLTMQNCLGQVQSNVSTFLLSSSPGYLTLISSYIAGNVANDNPFTILGTNVSIRNCIFTSGLAITDGTLEVHESSLLSPSTVLTLATTSSDFYNSFIFGNTNSVPISPFIISNSTLNFNDTFVGSTYSGATFSGSGTILINQLYPIGGYIINYGTATLLYANAQHGNVTANILSTPTFKTNPASSGSSSLALGSAYHNTLGYDILLTVYMNISNTTNANFLLGVGPTNTPTQQNIITNFNINSNTTHLVFPVPIYLPNNYYALLSTSGTVTATIIGQLAMPI